MANELASKDAWVARVLGVSGSVVPPVAPGWDQAMQQSRSEAASLKTALQHLLSGQDAPLRTLDSKWAIIDQQLTELDTMVGSALSGVAKSGELSGLVKRAHALLSESPLLSTIDANKVAAVTVAARLHTALDALASEANPA